MAEKPSRSFFYGVSANALGAQSLVFLVKQQFGPLLGGPNYVGSSWV